jgi:hypothetical protein
LLEQLRLKLILAFHVIQILPHISIYLRHFAGINFFTDEIEINVPVDGSQKMIPRYVVLDSKVEE